MEISVSLLNANNKIRMVNMLNSSDIKYFHIDVMDGIFVSHVSFLPEEIVEISNASSKNLDIHLMVENPIYYIEKVKELTNIEYITIHLEINKNITKILKLIKNYGFKAGISIKPNTDINLLKSYLEYLDLILVMTVEPGYGGQSFLPNSQSRIKKIKELTNRYNIKIEVDGGINNNTIKEVHDAEIAVVGSFITTNDDPIMQISKLQV